MAMDYIECAACFKDKDNYPKPSDISEVDITKSEFHDEGETVIYTVELDLEELKQKIFCS